MSLSNGHKNFNAMNSYKQKIERLTEENKKLRECLSFYANENNWKTDSTGCWDIITTDDYDEQGYEFPIGGKRARQCLKELEEV